MNKRVNFLMLLFLIFSGSIVAQCQYVQVGINGLTCSQCCKNVEMSIRKLSFVKDVQMDIQNTEAKIIFKDGNTVDIKRIAQAVIDGGFSVRYLTAVFFFNSVHITENYCWIYESSHYQFLKTTNKELNGLVKLTFIGKQYMPRDEYKIWEPVLEKVKGKGCEADHVYYVAL